MDNKTEKTIESKPKELSETEEVTFEIGPRYFIKQ